MIHHVLEIVLKIYLEIPLKLQAFADFNPIILMFTNSFALLNYCKKIISRQGNKFFLILLLFFLILLLLLSHFSSTSIVGLAETNTEEVSSKIVRPLKYAMRKRDGKLESLNRKRLTKVSKMDNFINFIYFNYLANSFQLIKNI